MTVIVGEAPVMEAQLITCTAEGTYNTVNLFETVIPALDGVGAKDNFTF
jgi:protein-L-isoaspartate(D-aspartate) O-methyltransferase